VRPQRLVRRSFDRILAHAGYGRERVSDKLTTGHPRLDVSQVQIRIEQEDGVADGVHNVYVHCQQNGVL